MIHLGLSFSGTCAVAQLSGGQLESDGYPVLLSARATAAAKGVRALILDFAAVPAVAASGIGALVELASLPHGPELILCGLPATAVARMRALGLDGTFEIHATRAAALASPAVLRQRLGGLCAVVLADCAMPMISPGGAPMPVALLDVLGQSLLRRNLDHLARAGIRSAIIVSGPEGAAIAASIHAEPVGNMAVFLTRSGDQRSGGCGAGAVLARLFADGNLAEETLVIDGNVLVDINLAALHAAHCANGADITLALRHQGPHADQPCWGEAGHLAAVPSVSDIGGSHMAGVCLVNARALAAAALHDTPDNTANTLADLLRRARGAGCAVHAQDDGCCGTRVTSWPGYARLLERALYGQIDGVRPVGQQVRGGLWVAGGAVIAPGASVHGPCFIGAGAQIGRGAQVHGPTIIGAGAHLGDHAFAGSAIVLPQTRIAAGSVLDHAIAGPGWALPRVPQTGADAEVLLPPPPTRIADAVAAQGWA